MAADEVQGRKEALALAVLRLLATRGMDAVSYGSVAVEAGVSKGLVQHYFPERSQLFDHASQVLARRMAARFEATLTGRKERTDTASGPDLFRVLVGMLPTDEDARLDAPPGARCSPWPSRMPTPTPATARGAGPRWASSRPWSRSATPVDRPPSTSGWPAILLGRWRSSARISSSASSPGARRARCSVSV